MWASPLFENVFYYASNKMRYIKCSTTIYFNYFISIVLWHLIYLIYLSHVFIYHLRLTNKSVVSVEIQVRVEDVKWNSDILPQMYTLSGKCLWGLGFFWPNAYHVCPPNYKEPFTTSMGHNHQISPARRLEKASAELQGRQIEFG